MSEMDLLKRIEELEKRVADLENALNTISMIDKSDRIADYLKKRQRSQRFISLVSAMTDEELGIRDSEGENEKRLADERKRLEKQIQAAIESEKNAVPESIESEDLFSVSDYSYGVEITGYKGFNPNTIVVPSTIKGKTVIRIGDKAFSNISCQSVVLPDTVKEIGKYAFSDSKNFQSVRLGKMVKSIGAWAFYGCKKLKSINLPDRIKQLGNFCFDSSGIEKIIIPGSVHTIPSHCFSDCSRLREIVISEGVTSVGNKAFEKCSINEIIFPQSMSIVDVELFGTLIGVGKCKLVFLGNNTDWEYDGYCFEKHIVYCAFGSKILQSSRRLGFEVHPISEYFDDK